MKHNEINFKSLHKRIVEQAYASARYEMTEEQKRKLIQDKFERARVLHEAQSAVPVLED